MSNAEALVGKLGSLSGSVRVISEGKLVRLIGFLYGDEQELNEQTESFMEEVQKLYPDSLIANEIKFLPHHVTVTVAENGSVEYSSVSKLPKSVLDEVRVVYMGMYPVSLLETNEKFKTSKQFHYPRVKKSIDVLNMFAPVVTDHTGIVIDGNLRIRCAVENNISYIPVIMVEADERKRDFLRLALNRSSEFQRWDYDTVDKFTDSNPQLQPVLEPLGFFGQTVLPESFFADTILNYEVDPFSNRQKDYRQEESLAEWAAQRKKEILEGLEERKASRRKKPVLESTVSLFDLTPSAEDFADVYDPYEEVKKNEESFRETAGVITRNYDKERNAIIEAQGRKFQNSRRNSSEVAEDNKKDFCEWVRSLGLSLTSEEELFAELGSPNVSLQSVVSESERLCEVEGIQFKPFKKVKGL